LSLRRRASIRVFATGAIVALLAVPAASAKLRMTLTLGDGMPAVGQATTVVVRSGIDLDPAARDAPGRRAVGNAAPTVVRVPADSIR
jgi:hypothetical protein